MWVLALKDTVESKYLLSTVEQGCKGFEVIDVYPPFIIFFPLILRHPAGLCGHHMQTTLPEEDHREMGGFCAVSAVFVQLSLLTFRAVKRGILGVLWLYMAVIILL